MKEPIKIEANDTRVLVNGSTLPVPFRIISEEGYQESIEQRSELLEALQDCLDGLNGAEYSLPCETVLKAEAAIKKAIG